MVKIPGAKRLAKLAVLWLPLTFLLAMPGQAVIDAYEFEDEVMRQRYLAFIEEMRCPKCQNQNLAGSDSPIASDLRRELHRLLMDGRSDKEIVDFMVDRYGDYVLYRPKVQRNTLVLWGLPLLLLVFGGLLVAVTLRQRRRSALGAEGQPQDEGQQEAQQQRLQELLEQARQRDQEQSDKDSQN
jgi:cytochrome c-type biogenesis protein CcmH